MMNDSNISNIGLFSESLSDAENKVEKVAADLRADFYEFQKNNVYYNPELKKNLPCFVLGIIISIAFIVLRFLCSSNSKLLDSIKNIEIKNLISDIILYPAVIYIFIFLLIFSLYNIVKIIYIKKIDRYDVRLLDIHNKALDRICDMKNGNYINELEKRMSAKEDIKLTQNNDLGEKIVALKSDFIRVNERDHKIRLGVHALFSIVLFSFILYFVAKTGEYINDKSMFSKMMLFTFFSATAAINLIEIAIGEYAGKFSKLIGAGLTAVYGLFMYLKFSSSLNFQVMKADELSPFVEKLNSACVLIPLIQFIAIILCVFTSHYGFEIEKWKNGFSVAMKYGTKDKGNKKTIIFRGIISFLLALGFCNFATIDMENDSSISGNIFYVIIAGVLWYCANTLRKPRGSYLYTFFGQYRSIANGVLILVAYFTLNICYTGNITSFEIIFLFGMGIVSIIAGTIANSINNNVY